MKAEKLIELLELAGRLKDNTRHSWTSKGRHESVAEHSWRLALMAYFVQDEFPEADVGRLLEMCILHDIGEAFTGDIPAFYKTDADRRAEDDRIGEWISGLPEPYRSRTGELFEDMNRGESLESRIWAALDKLETLVQHNEADISTWLPVEYELNFSYGKEQSDFSEYMRELRRVINERSAEKIELEKHG